MCERPHSMTDAQIMAALDGTADEDRFYALEWELCARESQTAQAPDKAQSNNGDA